MVYCVVDSCYVSCAQISLLSIEYANSNYMTEVTMHSYWRLVKVELLTIYPVDRYRPKNAITPSIKKRFAFFHTYCFPSLGTLHSVFTYG